MSSLRDFAGSEPVTASMRDAMTARGSGTHADTNAVRSLARIGPNAIIQTGMALRAYGGAGFEHDVFVRAGLAGYVTDVPQHMIDEAEAISLFEVIYHNAGLCLDDANAIMRDAGLRTGDYILANRIPKPAQRVLKILPKPLAARALLSAIGKHSWTFAGSGRFSSHYGRPLVIEIARNPLAFPGCHWHRAVFERLFGTLVSSSVHVSQTSGCAKGCNQACSVCRFEISF